MTTAQLKEAQNLSANIFHLENLLKSFRRRFCNVRRY